VRAPVAWHLAEQILECSWLNQPGDVIVRHGILLLRWILAIHAVMQYSSDMPLHWDEWRLGWPLFPVSCPWPFSRLACENLREIQCPECGAGGGPELGHAPNGLRSCILAIRQELNAFSCLQG
jgi:hypothetical protein